MAFTVASIDNRLYENAQIQIICKLFHRPNDNVNIIGVRFAVVKLAMLVYGWIGSKPSVFFVSEGLDDLEV